MKGNRVYKHTSKNVHELVSWVIYRCQRCGRFISGKKNQRFCGSYKKDKNSCSYLNHREVDRKYNKQRRE